MLVRRGRRLAMAAGPASFTARVGAVCALSFAHANTTFGLYEPPSSGEVGVLVLLGPPLVLGLTADKGMRGWTLALLLACSWIAFGAGGTMAGW